MVVESEISHWCHLEDADAKQLRSQRPTQYKTIVLNLLEQNSAQHEQLRQADTLLGIMNRRAE